MRRRSSLGFAVLLSLVTACESRSCDGSDDPIVPPSTLSASPSTLSLGVGGTAVVTVTVSYAKVAGQEGRPYPLQLEVEDNGVLEPLRATDVRMTTPGDLTFTAGPPKAWNFFVSYGTPSTFEVSVTCKSLGEGYLTAFERGTSPLAGRAVARVSCTNAPPTGERPPREFANGVGEMSVVDRSGASFTATPGGVASNLGERTAEMRAKYTDIGAHCEKYEGITSFQSDKGPDSLTADTSVQNGTATYDATALRYAWSGLAPGPMFSPLVSVVFAWSTRNLMVPPPAELDPIDQVLSPPAGLDTTYSVSDAETDVFVSIFGSLGSMDGFSCLYPSSALALENGRRTTAVVPTEVRNVIPDVGARLTTLFIGKVKQVDTPDLFPGQTRPLQTARLYRISRPLLDP